MPPGDPNELDYNLLAINNATYSIKVAYRENSNTTAVCLRGTQPILHALDQLFNCANKKVVYPPDLCVQIISQKVKPQYVN